MRNTALLAKRELAQFFNTTWGYAIIALILGIDGLMFNAFAMGSEPELSDDVLQNFFHYSSGTTMIASILLSMRLISEERSQGTNALLQTAPISEAQIIMGKFLGAFAFLSILTLMTIYMPALIQINGKVSWTHIFAGYLGLFCLGGTCLAIGTFGSAIAKNQLFASIISGVLVVFFILAWLVGKITDPPLKDIFSYLALYEGHFDEFKKGKINSESLVFYFSMTFAFLLLSVRVLQSRRQS